MADEKEIELSLTDSAMMSDSGVHLSTGTNRSDDEVMDFLRELMGEMKQQIVSLRGEMKEQNVSLRGEIKQQNVGLRGELKQINKHCDDIIEKMKDRTEKWKRDADKCNENKDD